MTSDKERPNPKYVDVRSQTPFNAKVRRSMPNWARELMTPVRARFYAPTQTLIEFMQGWALQAAGTQLDFTERLEIRGRTRLVGRVKPTLIVYSGFITPAADLMALDLLTIRRLLAHPAIRWQLSHDISGNDCLIRIRYPQSTAEVNRAEATYRRELIKTNSWI